MVTSYLPLPLFSLWLVITHYMQSFLSVARSQSLRSPQFDLPTPNQVRILVDDKCNS